MNEGMLRKKYFKWLIFQIDNVPNVDWNDYNLLLRELHRTTFIWSEETPELAMDINRAKDGLYLRERFDLETHLQVSEYFEEIGKDCSVLEMMIALAIRIENEIMGEGEELYGRWFWYMIKNLRLQKMTDYDFDEVKTRQILRDLLYRDVTKKVKTFFFNCHSVEKTVTFWAGMQIWDQMGFWINEKFGGKLGFY